MKKTLLLVAFLIATFIGLNAQSEHYYYYQGEKIYLDLDLKRISVNSFTTDTSFLSKILSNDFLVSEVVAQYGTNPIYYFEIEFENSLSKANYNLIIDNLNVNQNIKKISPAYKINEHKIGLTNNFYVKLKKNADITTLEQYVNNFGLEILKQDGYMPLWYVISTSKEHINSLNLSNVFYESGLFETAEPELTGQMVEFSNDPFFGDQWGLKNTGQYGSAYAGIDIKAEEAWTISTGSGVKIAIYDHGFEMDHPDLQANVYGTGFDANIGTSPSVIRGSHGTPCAGIAGATQNNNLGISGVAPNTSLTSISIRLVFSDTPQQLASGFNWAVENGMDIISNSWGGYAPNQIIDDAISNALNNGRNGKGCVVVFAAGNYYTVNSNKNVSFPANSLSEILVVGAISPCGERKSHIISCDDESWGSCYGSQLDVVAPGVKTPTTDRQGANGYNNGEGSYETNPNYYDHKDYFSSFNGTSAACPVVAGVAALILSVNPCLTGKQVRDIIEKTAQKVGNYSYTNNTDRPNGTWNNEMGYGLVNAYEAVLMAQQTGIDLYISDCVNDFGDEPSLVCQDVVWHSPDIWVRNNQDNIAQNQNPIYKSNGEPNYIYVRVKNRGCTQSGVNDKLQVHWTKANTSFAWPNYWNGTELNINGVPLGGSLSAIDIPSIAADGDVVLEIPWVVPNPQDYSNFGDEMWHYCLMARIISDDDQMTYPETEDHFSNVKNNNNIAHKNVTIIAPAQGKINGVIAVGNPFVQDEIFDIKFVSDILKGNEIFREAEISFVIDETLQRVLNQSKVRLHNIKQIENNRFLITGDDARLEGLQFDSKQIGLLDLRFNFLTQKAIKNQYVYHVIQTREDGSVVGGEAYEIQREPRALFSAVAVDLVADKNEMVTLNAETINEPAVYNWYDTSGNLIHEGIDFETSVTFSQKYKLEVIALSDGYKDYAEAKIDLKPNRIEIFYPNPASDQAHVNYIINQGENAYLSVVPMYGGVSLTDTVSNNYILDLNNNTRTLNLNDYSEGLYKIILVVNGEISDTKTLIKY